jgi:hypothetical protein
MSELTQSTGLPAIPIVWQKWLARLAPDRRRSILLRLDRTRERDPLLTTRIASEARVLKSSKDLLGMMRENIQARYDERALFL